MNRIIIIRHGESIGNANNIIQGRNNDYGLTEKGKEYTLSNIQTNMNLFAGATRIITSTSKRTIETAEIIAKQLDLPLMFNSSLEEMDAGVLSGMKKDTAKTNYPNYYQIWKERKDLDSIPYAETGENLQARVIGFLIQYYEEPQFCDVIVSHAGFIRCLINIIENRERTFQFDIENSSIFLVDNLFEKMDIQKRERAMNSKVLIINTANGKYVAKLKRGRSAEQDYAERDLLDCLPGDNLPRILSMQKISDDRFCKIIKYVKGRHIYGKLKEKEYNALIESEEKFEKTLKQVKSTKFRTNNLSEKLKIIYMNAKNEYIKEKARILLDSKYSKIINNVECYVLSHNDFNRDNILFEEIEKGKTRANIIDFESLEFAPPDFQFASMLASGMLLEGEDMQKIKQTIQRRGKDVGTILYLMQIRTLEGLYFFAEKENEYSTTNKKASGELLKKYFFNSEIIQREIVSLQTPEIKREGREEL